jgi:hypothetical protein
MATVFTRFLRKFRAPALSIPPIDYAKVDEDQFRNMLRIYFNQIDSAFGNLLDTTGGKYINFPYGAFSSDQDQTTTANTATLMTLNTTDFANGVSISSSKITVENAGIYNLQFSAQLENTSNAPQDVYIWLRQGNDGGSSADITGSTGLVGMPARKNPGDPFHDIKGWNYFVSMAENDYIQIYWSTTSANVSIQYYAASGSPTKPSTQSVVATLSFVSALPVA